MESLRIKYRSGVYILEAVQIIKASLNDVWLFFSKPDNLKKITPSEMNFKISSGGQDEIYSGQIITYKVNVLGFLKSNWVTEISQVKEYEYFIDEQRFGPYTYWHHEHHFQEVEQGVKMYDKVVYKVPFGLLGRLVNHFYIKSKLMKIFNYRFYKALEIFK